MVESASRNADNRHILRDLDPHVFQRSPAAAFSRPISEFEATIAISTLDVLEGQLPRRALNLVQEWAMIHSEELLEDWLLCREKTQPSNIEPLP